MAISAFRVFIRIIENTSLTGTGCFDSPYSYGSFASGVLGLVCGIIGGLFVLLSFTFLFASPIDRKMFLEALIFADLKK